MTRPLDEDLRELLVGRAAVDDADIEALRGHVATLPDRRARRRGLFAAAAGIVLLLGFAGVLVANLPSGRSGAASRAPDPAAFAGDPRLAVCGLGPDGAVAIFEMAHVRDYGLHLPAAYELKGLDADPEAPALVIVRVGPGSPDRMGSPAPPGSHDLCMVVGADAASWQMVDIVGVDTTALTALLPQPTGTPPPSPSPSPLPTSTLPVQIDPADCARMGFAEDRCLAVVERAIGQAGLTWAEIERASLATVPNTGYLVGGFVAGVTFVLRDGTRREQDVICRGIGGQYSLVCTDRPEVRLSSPIGGGYHDVPCTGEAPEGCASPVPTIAPDAAASAVPLEVLSHDYPITGLGPQEILVGRATLPNGILSDGRFSLADPFTRAFTVRDGIVLVVRSLDPARPPFFNIYEHGWYPGTEEVEVYLVFDVLAVKPGATLEVRDLVVR